MMIKIYRDKIIELVHPNCYLYFESGMSIIYPRKEHFQNNVYLLTLGKVNLELCTCSDDGCNDDPPPPTQKLDQAFF